MRGCGRALSGVGCEQSADLSDSRQRGLGRGRRVADVVMAAEVARAAVRELRAQGARLEGVAAHSGRVRAGVAFLAYPGESGDGRRHIAAALEAGAAGVFWESSEGFAWPGALAGAPNVAVQGLRGVAGAIASEVYGRPSEALRVAAVTGTNGKSTVAQMAAQLLACAGVRCGVLGTLGAGEVAADGSVVGGGWRELGNTTPDAATLQEALRGFVEDGVESCVLEASSHGIVQGRLAGTRLAAAALTNVGSDHLDYHGTQAAYKAAKAGLFDLPEAAGAVVVLNADDELGAELSGRLQGVCTYGRAGKALWLVKMAALGIEWRVTLAGEFGEREVVLPLPGQHNVYNFMAAALMARALSPDVTWEAIFDAAPRLRLPAGRMQRVETPIEAGDGATIFPPQVFVDYAHTPDAIAATIAAAISAATAAARADESARAGVFVVFGAGGERDAEKRAGMARAASEADAVVITDDNPRGEDAAKIRAELRRHVSLLDGQVVEEGDRGAAITAAVLSAHPGDTVLILGKGHEKTQEAGGVKTPFCDVTAARAALAQWVAGAKECARCG